MIHSTISLSACIEDWALKSGRSQEATPEDLILTVASDVARMVRVPENLVERVTLIPIQNYKGIFPDDLRYIIQVAFEEDPQDCCVKEKVIEQTEKLHGCKVTTRIDCPSCGSTTGCGCAEPFLEVDANFVWQTANPQVYNSHVKHFHSYGHTHHRGDCWYYPGWRLIRKTTNNFFNTPYHINDCVNFKVDRDVEYNVDMPTMIVNRKAGQALVAYLGIKTQDGLLMVPDLPEMFQAVFFSVEEALCLQEYLQTGGQREAMKYERMKAEAIKWRRAIRGRLRIPDINTWKNMIQNHWKRILPSFPGSEMDMNRFNPESRFTTHASLNTKPYFEAGQADSARNAR